MRLYGLTNMGMRLERSVPRDPTGSFEARLEALLTARSKLPMQIIGKTSLPSDAPVARGRVTYADLIAFAPTPTIDSRFEQFLDDYNRTDILIAIFPLLRNGGPSSTRPLAELIWASDAQDRYWPLVTGDPLIKENLYESFRRELASQLIAMCD